MQPFWNKFRRYPVKQPVQLDSSALSWVEYHPGHQSLDVEFRSGSHYRYGCIDSEVYHGLLDSGSKGRFFVQKIRDHFPCMRVD